jgi:nicotinamidase-related amidase
MPELVLPVRRCGANSNLDLLTERVAFLLVDCTTNQGELRTDVMRSAIAPALRVARNAGIRPAYLYESGQGTGGPADILREMAAARPSDGDWKPKAPNFDAAITPHPAEPVLAKWGYDGFAEGHIDYYLRSYKIDTIIAVGFRLPCCLFQTCLGARCRNYRVILLRDCTCPPGSLERPDTLNVQNPEGGWARYIFLHWFETLVGYTSTAREFLDACGRAGGRAQAR